MKSPRLTVLAAVLAFGFLLLVSATPRSPSSAQEIPDTEPLFTGNVCRLDGPLVVKPGEKNLYAFRVQDDVGDDLLGGLNIDHEFMVNIDNTTGNAKVTGVFLEDGDTDKDKDKKRGMSLAGHKEIDGANVVDSVDVESAVFMREDLVKWLEDKYDYKVPGNPCGAGAISIVWACIGNGECETLVETSEGDELNAWAEAIDEALEEGPPFKQCLPPEDDSLPEIGDRALRAAGYKDADGRKELYDWLISYCETFFAPYPSVIDAFGAFEVTCIDPGTYEITLADRSKPSSITRTVTCQGVPSEKSTMAFQPTGVEIVPSLGNVSHSFLLVTLVDDEGRAPQAEFDVDFTTDRCSVETSGVDTADEIVAASQLFAAYAPNVPGIAAAIEASDAAKATVDSSPAEDTTKSLTISNTSRAAAIFGCNPTDAPGATPGVATVTAVIEAEGPDIVLTAQIQVVGPPALMEISAQPAQVRCGEKVAIQAAVGDAARQAVSNLTLIEATTNLGGVLGGTGAVAGQAGPVVPLSSTVAETFDGRANFYLLTSEQHTGPYQVAIRAGGGGAVQRGEFTSPPVVAIVEVSCALPAPAAPQANTQNAAAVPVAAQQPPALTAPRTGEGLTIKPPNTGSGGLIPQ